MGVLDRLRASRAFGKPSEKADIGIDMAAKKGEIMKTTYNEDGSVKSREPYREPKPRKMPKDDLFESKFTKGSAKSGYGKVRGGASKFSEGVSRFNEGIGSFSAGAEKVSKRLGSADSYLSNMDFGFDMGGGMSAPRRRSSSKSVPIYRGKKIVGYRKVKGSRRMMRSDDMSGDYSLDSIDSGIIGSFDMPRGKKGQSNDFGINWF